MKSKYLLLAICLWAGMAVFVSAQTGQKKKVKAIKGTVVAVDKWSPMMGWHSCNLRLLIKLEKTSPARHAILNVECFDDRGLKEQGPHNQLIEQSEKWEFKVSLDDRKTSVLERYMNVDVAGPGEAPKIEAWRLLKGAENEVLPFGENLSLYKVGNGEYKQIN